MTHQSYFFNSKSISFDNLPNIVKLIYKNNVTNRRLPLNNAAIKYNLSRN